MMKRPRVVTAALLAVVTAVPLVALARAEAARNRKPRITRVVVSPTRLPASGSSVSVDVTVDPGTGTVSGVTVSVQGSGGGTALVPQGGNRFRGSVGIPANTSRKKRAVKLIIQANTSAGVIRKSARVIQEGGGAVDPNSPPPPPPI